MFALPKLNCQANFFVCFTLQILFCLSWRVRSECYGDCVGNEVIEMHVLESIHLRRRDEATFETTTHKLHDIHIKKKEKKRGKWVVAFNMET